MKLILANLMLLTVQESSQFVFPDTVREVRPRAEYNEVKDGGTEGCPGGEDYCEEPLSYPASKIAKALQKVDSNLMRSLLSHSIEETEEVFGIGLRSMPSIAARTRANPGARNQMDYEKVCHSTKEFIKPKQARNKEGEYLFIVNGGEGLEDNIQMVTVSKCLGTGERCSLETEEETECRQEYSEHRLVALDSAGQQLVMETFTFPSGCSCYKLNPFY